MYLASTTFVLTLLLGLLAGVIGFAALAIALGYTRLPPRNARDSRSLPVGTESWLDRQIAPLLEAHPAESGFALVSDGTEAFALRALAARAASRSLDAQYYIWNEDLTGLLLIRELVEAADRGVRVRLLLDDLDARAKNFALGGLDVHPNIEIRVFNPFASRRGIAGKLLEAVTAFSRINHRMHTKTFIADNRFTISGGRNVGDEYFAASEDVNFLDLDLAMVGPVVDEMSAAFDEYWNSEAVWPIASLQRTKIADIELQSLRERATAAFERASNSDYARSLAGSDSVARVLESAERLHWVSRWQLLSDDPMKAVLEDSAFERSAVLRGLDAALNNAERSATLVSPYFVPGAGGTAALSARSKAGITMGVLTNSLAATDVAAVHGGYAKNRKTLLEHRVQLWELKPHPGQVQARPTLFGSKRASLHTKAAVFDRVQLFVGSFNLDPRSVSLNCEHGVLIEDAAFSCEVARLIAFKVSRELAWRVGLDERGALTWTDGNEQFRSEPLASRRRRALAKIVGWLPLEPHL
jgi:putative cardiolipin synthase